MFFKTLNLPKSVPPHAYRSSDARINVLVLIVYTLIESKQNANVTDYELSYSNAHVSD